MQGSGNNGYGGNVSGKSGVKGKGAKDNSNKKGSSATKEKQGNKPKKTIRNVHKRKQK